MAEPNDDNKDNKSAFTSKVWMVGGILSLIIIILLLFKTLFSVVLLTLAGILMAIYFHGLAGLLHRWLHLPYKVSVLLSVLLNFILLAGFFWFVGARLQDQVTQLSETLPRTISHAKDWLKQYPAGDKVAEYLNSSGDTGKSVSILKKFFSSSFGILSDVYIILLLGLFFTASPKVYKKGVIRLLPPQAKEKGDQIMDKMHRVLKDWIKGQLFGFMFIAVLTAIGLWIMGMPLILTLALIAGLMNFIPNFGPIIALVPALLLALMQGTDTALLVFGLYTGIQVVQSAVTQPLIQKKMVSMPPALVIFGQVAMGLLSGFWGVLLATPVIAVLMTLVDQLYIKQQHDDH
ncbi:AI-2E family transporter [Mucilaginibacter segetis]|uniref:AI-2E family transporter n=1 Tax=Mucilaginibacter segetis TaxID=2793071 RepID=A0A934PNK5_9SPHI|nr:AI-2E family transporter [Mucilaginibacter segetis]MBK0377853.1 AI-2E family transporter [Mucilaginibacter segetis]